MHPARTLACAVAAGLVSATVWVGTPGTAAGIGRPWVGAADQDPDTTPPVLTGLRVRPKVLSGARAAWLKVTSSEEATLRGVVLLKQDGRWHAASEEKAWSLGAGHNLTLLYSKGAQALLRDGRYRIRLSATDAAGNRSSKVVLSFRVDH